MLFFQRFPALSYDTTEGVDKQVINREVPNMTVKVVMDILLDPKLPYLNYRIKDTDRPDTVAAQMYGSARYAWVVLMANKMRDWFDWPLTELEFRRYMDAKYESAPGANDGSTVARTMVYQYVWNHPEIGPLVVTQNMYSNSAIVPTAQREYPPVSYFRKEYEDNDAKRLIRLPTPDVVSNVNMRLSELMRA